MLVEQEHLGLPQGRHQERESLALAARQGSDPCAETSLETEAHVGESAAKHRPARLGDRAAETPRPTAACGHGQVLLDGHPGTRALLRILRDAPDRLRPGMGRLARHVAAVELHATGVGGDEADHRLEERRLPGPVGADERYELSRAHVHADAGQRGHLVRRALPVGLRHADQPQHGRPSPTGWPP